MTAARRAAVDLARRAPRLVGRGLIKVYRVTFSPLVGFHCRHLPTCSEYSDEALDRLARFGGGWMTLARLCRCHPWGTSGLDFVPLVPPAHARWYLPWRYARWRTVNASAPRAVDEAIPPDGRGSSTTSA